MDERSQDVVLLQAFARRSDQPAFTMLVRRHLDLVYTTALRKVGDSGAAEEITQDVFSVLARNAWQFAAEDSVAAWLHRATLLKGKAWWRGELRRREREKTATELETTMKTSDEQPALRALVPLLDEGLLSLSEKDRTSLLLRFYENQPLREVGACLGTGEDAAQKRVASALAKLVRFFQRRGYRTATVSATAAALQHTAGSAPALVVSAVTQAAMKMSPAAIGGFVPLLSRLAGLSKLQAASLCAVILAAPAGYQWNRLQTAKHDSIQARAELSATDRELEAVQEEIDQLRRQSEQLARDIPAELELQSRNNAAVAKLAELKRRLQDVLAASEYRWPNDLPYVRVPRSAVDNVFPNSPAFDPSGKLTSWTVEFLGLTPKETEFTESHFSQYLQQVYQLASSRSYETNSSWLPQREGWITKTIAVPDLGNDRERLWTGLIEPVLSMLGQERRNHFTSFWMHSMWGGVTYPWLYEDEKQTRRSSHQYVFAIKPDGTDRPEYSLLWVGNKSQPGRLPLPTSLPAFLGEHFEPWLQSLGVSSIYADQP